jgi:hypothetical protein
VGLGDTRRQLVIEAVDGDDADRRGRELRSVSLGELI